MRHRAVVGGALLLLLLFPLESASAGYVTGIGPERTAHLFDEGNGVSATVVVPESFSGFAGFTYEFSLVGSNGTFPRTYGVAVVVSPGKDTEARFNGSGALPLGVSNASVRVSIPPETLRFTLANSPFQVELRAEDGALLDSAAFSVDLRYREPPPDGGLMQLALATGFFWGLVFLYALYLHSAQRKLRAKAEALERSVAAHPEEVRADGSKR